MSEGPKLEYGEYGMYLRDYFAAKALQGWFANAALDAALPEGKKFEQFQAEIASMLYGWADAMVKARQDCSAADQNIKESK